MTERRTMIERTVNDLWITKRTLVYPGHRQDLTTGPLTRAQTRAMYPTANKPALTEGQAKEQSDANREQEPTGWDAPRGQAQGDDLQLRGREDQGRAPLPAGGRQGVQLAVERGQGDHWRRRGQRM